MLYWPSQGMSVEVDQLHRTIPAHTNGKGTLFRHGAIHSILYVQAELDMVVLDAPYPPISTHAYPTLASKPSPQAAQAIIVVIHMQRVTAQDHSAIQ